jgi:hypothetical protein
MEKSSSVQSWTSSSVQSSEKLLNQTPGPVNDVLALAQRQKSGQAGPNQLAFSGFWPSLDFSKAQAGD